MQRHLLIAALILGFPLYALLARNTARSCPPSGCAPLLILLPELVDPAPDGLAGGMH